MMKFYIIFVALFVLLISILSFAPEQKQISLTEHLLKEGIIYRGADGYLYDTPITAEVVEIPLDAPSTGWEPEEETEESTNVKTSGESFLVPANTFKLPKWPKAKEK